MGLPSPPDPLDEGSAENGRLQKLSWCGRQIPEGELAYASAGNAVVTVWEMNGMGICAACAERVAQLILDNAGPRA
jgi:hypothetical protein